VSAPPIILPVARQNPSQSQITTLDGRRYSIRLEWIGRLARWAVDLSTESGTPILRCKVAALRSDLLRQVRHRTDVPPGILVMVDTLNQDAEAGLSTLGSRHLLMYYGS
jgi:hypothetical protein